MTRRRRVDGWMATAVLASFLAAPGWGGNGASAAPELATVFIPAGVTFFVSNVNAPTTGSPQPATFRFMDATLKNKRALEVSVKADNDFTPPSAGPAIPASLLSWSVSGVTNGFGSNGVLSKTSYGLVYQSVEDAVSGRVDLTWTLGAPGSAVVAGPHQMTVRWRLESVRP